MFDEITGRHIYLIGIKGTGMASLAAALQRAGAVVSGSDIAERFYTDELLEEEGIAVCEGFRTGNIPPDTSLVVASPAYTAENNEELAQALKRGLQVMTYVDVLAELSAQYPTCAVAGTHGKSSTSAMADHLMQALGIPHLSIYGTALQERGPVSSLPGGQLPLFIEACEYRDHFLAYSPEVIILTSMSLDHPDHFGSMEAVRSSFRRFLGRLAPGGAVVYACEDPEVDALVRAFISGRPDVKAVPYGVGAVGDCGISGIRQSTGKVTAEMAGVQIALRVPGAHMVRNMAAAAAAVSIMTGTALGTVLPHTEGYPGCLRRSELIGTAGGVTIVDDYGHHPEEISATLGALREFYQPNRLVVDFIPHTISRTQALFAEFADAFGVADEVYIHPVWTTVREADSDSGSAQRWSRTLAGAVGGGRFLGTGEADLREIRSRLQPGDLFITMGAGNNRFIGEYLLDTMTEGE